MSSLVEAWTFLGVIRVPACLPLPRPFTLGGAVETSPDPLKLLHFPASKVHDAFVASSAPGVHEFSGIHYRCPSNAFRGPNQQCMLAHPDHGKQDPLLSVDSEYLSSDRASG